MEDGFGMMWRKVKSVKELPAGKIRVLFEGCDHEKIVSLANLVRTAAENPESLVGKGYNCNLCYPGEEVDTWVK
jgi:hypothetical protein